LEFLTAVILNLEFLTAVILNLEFLTAVILNFKYSGNYAVWTGKLLPTFSRILVRSSSGSSSLVLGLLEPEYEGITMFQNDDNSLPVSKACHDRSLLTDDIDHDYPMFAASLSSAQSSFKLSKKIILTCHFLLYSILQRWTRKYLFL
jgi:hypothetical protein